MPDPKTLSVGDRIRILRVPDGDLRLREEKRARNEESTDCTADAIELIIEQTPIVPITRIDDDGCVWYETQIIGSNGTEEWHSLIIYDDDSWELA